jgi:hypothetical protein
LEKITKDFYNENLRKTSQNEDMAHLFEWNHKESDNNKDVFDFNVNMNLVNDNYHNIDHDNRNDYSYEKNSGEDNEKLFKNFDSEENTGILYEGFSQDNYNNYNSPKFTVNYNKFKPWIKLLRDRNDNNFEIYHKNNEKNDMKPVFGSRHMSEYNTNDFRHRNSYEMFNDEKERHKRRHEEIKSFVKNGLKKLRLHFEKHRDEHILPQNYGWIKREAHKMPYKIISRLGFREKLNETPNDLLDHSFGGKEQPLGTRSDEKPLAKIEEYRYGF